MLCEASARVSRRTRRPVRPALFLINTRCRLPCSCVSAIVVIRRTHMAMRVITHPYRGGALCAVWGKSIACFGQIAGVRPGWTVPYGLSHYNDNNGRDARTAWFGGATPIPSTPAASQGGSLPSRPTLGFFDRRFGSLNAVRLTSVASTAYTRLCDFLITLPLPCPATGGLPPPGGPHHYSVTQLTGSFNINF